MQGAAAATQGHGPSAGRRPGSPAAGRPGEGLPPSAGGAPVARAPQARAPASRAVPHGGARSLLGRIGLLVAVCALLPWLVAAVLLAPGPGGGAAVLLALGGAMAALWLLLGVARQVAALAAPWDAYQQACQLLRQRTRERDHALRDNAELARAVRQDALTGLANRSAFLERLHASLDSAAADGGAVTVFFIDLDDFKSVNDTHGHAVGDALLQAFATRLRGEVRNVDLAARLSGDEFVLLVEGLAPGQAGLLARSVVRGLSGAYAIGDRSIRVSASVGLAGFPQDGRTAGELLRAADAAMYQAKAAGKGGWRRWEAAPPQAAGERRVHGP